VTLDLAVEDLLERLKSGKIYASDKVPWALAHFFKSENLQTLRELSLREVAESLDRSAQNLGDKARERSVAAGRVMVCLSSHPPRAKVLLRRASRMTGRLNTDWFCVYVETPKEAPTLIDAEAQRHLLANIELARELGAEVLRLKHSDPVQAILDFARSHAVGRIVIGRSKEPLLRRVLRLSVFHRLVDQADDFDLHIVSFEGDMEEAL
jgi:two-component system sensor histidine kinase KdpD